MGRSAARLALACAPALVLLFSATRIDSATAATTHTIVIEAVTYRPESVTVKRGDTVLWINKDPFPHTVTAKGVFDSHVILPGRSWKYTPRKTGDHAYTCTLHPTMRGTLKVQ